MAKAFVIVRNQSSVPKAVELARHLEEALDDSLTPRKFELVKKLRELRFKVHEKFSRRWTVEEMARMCFLSSSRFTVLCKEFFHRSPIEDLIDQHSLPVLKTIANKNPSF